MTISAPQNSVSKKKIGARIEVSDLVKTFGSTVAVDHVSFAIEAGEFVALLGPSGSGKTTILMNIAGFQSPTGGRVLVSDNDILPLPAHKRNIGMVFQKYALFPHMTVAENIAFPLQMRGYPKVKQAEAVKNALETVRMGNLAARMPSQLSGGQQQRVALARAIVFEPPLLLMDEPLGALDKKLREELQFEIKALQERLGITVLFVTHDQDEALAMSDRIAVMSEGRIEQIGPPTELYRTPLTLFVADFMGDSNFFGGTVLAVDTANRTVQMEAGGVSFSGTVHGANLSAFVPGQTASVMVRPESIRVVNGCEHAPGNLTGVVQSVLFGGSKSTVAIEAQGKIVHAVLPVLPGAGHPSLSTGLTVSLDWIPADAVAFTALPEK